MRYISSNAFASLADYSFDPAQDYSDEYEASIKPFSIIYTKIDFIPFLFKVLKYKPYFLITDCDLPINEDRVALMGDNLLHWFGTNADVSHPRVTALPIGVPPLKAANGIGNRAYLDYFLQEEEAIHKVERLAYLNCIVQNNPAKRLYLYNWAKDKPYIKVEGGKERVPYSIYIKNIRTSAYTLSPEGAGIDCHRTWEALYLGSIPVIDYSKAMAPFFHLFPMMTTTDFIKRGEDELWFIHKEWLHTGFMACKNYLDFNFWEVLIRTKIQSCLEYYAMKKTGCEL